jgi:hypothetical protein
VCCSACRRERGREKGREEGREEGKEKGREKEKVKEKEREKEREGRREREGEKKKKRERALAYFCKSSAVPVTPLQSKTSRPTIVTTSKKRVRVMKFHTALVGGSLAFAAFHDTPSLGNSIWDGRVMLRWAFCKQLQAPSQCWLLPFWTEFFWLKAEFPRCLSLLEAGKMMICVCLAGFPFDVFGKVLKEDFPVVCDDSRVVYRCCRFWRENNLTKVACSGCCFRLLRRTRNHDTGAAVSSTPKTARRSLPSWGALVPQPL